MKFSRFLSVALATLLILMTAPVHAKTNDGPLLDRVVATVNKEAIAASELNRQTELLLFQLRQTDTDSLPARSEVQKKLLERMVLEKLQLQLAESAKITVDDATVNKTLQEMAARDNVTVDQMRQFFEEHGVSFKQFRQSIKTSMIISKLHQREISPHVNVSKEEVAHFLKSSASSLPDNNLSTEYRLSHILIALPESPDDEDIATQKQKADSILQELKSGVDFAKTAMAKSAGSHAAEGGDLGWRKAADVPSLFTKTLPKLRVGEIYGPIKDNSGFHIIKLVSKRGNDETNSTASLRNRAMEVLFQRKFDEQLGSWLKTLRADAEVHIYFNESS